MREKYVTPETSVYALSTQTLLSASDFDFVTPDSSGDGFVNTGDDGIPPGSAM